MSVCEHGYTYSFDCPHGCGHMEAAALDDLCQALGETKDRLDDFEQAVVEFMDATTLEVDAERWSGLSEWTTAWLHAANVAEHMQTLYADNEEMSDRFRFAACMVRTANRVIVEGVDWVG